MLLLSHPASSFSGRYGTLTDTSSMTSLHLWSHAPPTRPRPLPTQSMTSSLYQSQCSSKLMMDHFKEISPHYYISPTHVAVMSVRTYCVLWQRSMSKVAVRRVTVSISLFPVTMVNGVDTIWLHDLVNKPQLPWLQKMMNVTPCTCHLVIVSHIV